MFIRKCFILCAVLFLIAGCATPTATPTPSPFSQPSATYTTRPSVTASVDPRPQPSAAPKIEIAPLKEATVDLYGLVELEIDTNISVENAFDPEQLNIRVRLTSPSGEIVDIGAFWTREYNHAGYQGWKARFTPTETGVWTASALVTSNSLTSNTVSFEVIPSNRPGFVRIHPENPRYFATDNGDFFFPIGMNLAWWCGTCDPLETYAQLMDLFRAKGGNTIRVWMADWSFGIEHGKYGLGNYAQRMQQAWLLDQVFKMAAERDMYIILVLLNCADYNNWQTNGWNTNPYNAVLGGPLTTPQEFATNLQAIKYFERRLTYIVNRWGYSPNLLAWEWWNEVDLTGIPDRDLVPWIQEVSAHLRGVDVNHHLTTNSYAIPEYSATWLLQEVHIVMRHEYPNQKSPGERDMGRRALRDFEELTAALPPKPLLLGEFGASNMYEDEINQRTGIHLHNGIWATTFSGYAGSGMYWYWDVILQEYNLWYHFNGLSSFIEEVDLTHYRAADDASINGIGDETDSAIVMAMRREDEHTWYYGSETALVWMRTNQYTTDWALANPGRSPATLQSQVLTLPGMADGSYTVRWFDPIPAKWLAEEIVTSHDRILTLKVPAFSRDLAAQIVLNP